MEGKFEKITKATNKRLSPEAMANIEKEFGVTVEGEHFVFDDADGKKQYVPTWESIPYSETGKREDAVGIPIEEYLKHLLRADQGDEGKEAA